MGIKVKNVSPDSCLHKYFIDLHSIGDTAAAPGNLSAGDVMRTIVPVACNFKRALVVPHVDITASLGITVKVENLTTSQTFLDGTLVPSSTLGSKDWSADIVRAFDATSDYSISAGSFIQCTVSATVSGPSPLGISLEFGIDKGRQK